MLTTGELFPARRLLTDEVEGTEMEGVEHLGQYVFEMTQAKVGILKREGNVSPHQKAEVGVADCKETDGERGEVKVEADHDSELDNIT